MNTSADGSGAVQGHLSTKTGKLPTAKGFDTFVQHLQSPSLQPDEGASRNPHILQVLMVLSHLHARSRTESKAQRDDAAQTAMSRGFVTSSEPWPRSRTSTCFDARRRAGLRAPRGVAGVTVDAAKPVAFHSKSDQFWRFKRGFCGQSRFHTFRNLMGDVSKPSFTCAFHVRLLACSP